MKTASQLGYPPSRSFTDKDSMDSTVPKVKKWKSSEGSCFRDAVSQSFELTDTSRSGRDPELAQTTQLASEAGRPFLTQLNALFATQCY